MKLCKKPVKTKCCQMVLKIHPNLICGFVLFQIPPCAKKKKKKKSMRDNHFALLLFIEALASFLNVLRKLLRFDWRWPYVLRKQLGFLSNWSLLLICIDAFLISLVFIKPPIVQKGVVYLILDYENSLAHLTNRYLESFGNRTTIFFPGL